MALRKLDDEASIPIRRIGYIGTLYPYSDEIIPFFQKKGIHLPNVTSSYRSAQMGGEKAIREVLEKQDVHEVLLGGMREMTLASQIRQMNRISPDLGILIIATAHAAKQMKNIPDLPKFTAFSVETVQDHRKFRDALLDVIPAFIQQQLLQQQQKKNDFLRPHEHGMDETLTENLSQIAVLSFEILPGEGYENVEKTDDWHTMLTGSLKIDFPGGLSVFLSEVSPRSLDDDLLQPGSTISFSATRNMKPFATFHLLEMKAAARNGYDEYHWTMIAQVMGMSQKVFEHAGHIISSTADRNDLVKLFFVFKNGREPQVLISPIKRMKYREKN